MKLTKLELEQANARLASYNAELYAQVTELQYKLGTDSNAALRAQVADLQYKLDTIKFEKRADALRAAMPKVAHAVPAWQAQRAIDMAEARAIAMATGRVIKV